MGLLNETLKDLILIFLLVVEILVLTRYERQIKALPRSTFVGIVAVAVILLFLFLRYA